VAREGPGQSGDADLHLNGRQCLAVEFEEGLARVCPHAAEEGRRGKEIDSLTDSNHSPSLSLVGGRLDQSTGLGVVL
jgi:hypothetical protein